MRNGPVNALEIAVEKETLSKVNKKSLSLMSSIRNTLTK